MGTTFSLVTSATKWKYLNTLILAFTFFVCQIPFTTTAAWLVPDQPHQVKEDAETAVASRPDPATTSNSSESTVLGEGRLKEQVDTYTLPTNPLV